MNGFTISATSSTVLIPTFSDPAYSETVNLDGTDYVLDFDFNQRQGMWHLSLSLPDGTVLASGLALVPFYDILGKTRAVDNSPQGLLWVQASGADDSPPGIAELGAGLRCELWYVTVS